MIKVIKAGITEDVAASIDAQVKSTVENIIADIRKNGDAAVRSYSQKFDGWSPENFKLSAQAIQDIIATLPQQAIDDIKWAQAQIRNFAQHQRAALKDIEVETLPGVFLGHKNIPVNRVG